MNSKLLQQAKTLASRSYDVVVEHDELSDGSSIILASNPELQGCKSQGRTVEQAIENLNAARIDYIYSLLEDGLSVPEPNSQNTATRGLSATFITYSVDYDVEALHDSKPVVQPTNEVPLYQRDYT